MGYKLYYFHSRGRAETARFIFKQAGIDFEDVRLKGEEWAEFKPKTPFGQMPVLEVDGKMLAGSGTIHRYLAEEFGLAGSNAWENAQLDSIMGVGDDLSQGLIKMFFGSDEEKAAGKKKFEEESGPKYLGILEKILTSNSSGWLFGDKVTYVDFALYNIISWIKMSLPTLIDKYPGIVKNTEAVEALPNIAKWLKEQPVTQH